jgi:FkbM family methyltransferase
MIGPSSGTFRADVFGFRMTLNLSDYIQRNISWGQYEALETKIISAHLHPGGMFVDVGANIGYYTALAASLVGATGLVLAFEPDPECFQALVSTFSTKPNIRCMQIAVSDSVGTLKLYIPPDSEHNHDSSWLAYCEGMTAFNSKTTTLDIALGECGRVQLLKMDIEGHEPQAVHGGRRVLGSGRVERVLCELNQRLLRLAGSSRAELVELLQSCGFELEQQIGGEVCANALFRHRSAG